jgi:hypothetical protein
MDVMYLSPFTGKFLEQYKAAAAEGAIVELKMRLLADKIPALQKYAHEKNLSNVEAEVTKHFRTSLTDADIETLCLCRRLRNKILHCDFRVARDKLEELNVPRPHRGVQKLDVRCLSGAQVAEEVASAKAGVEGAFVYVADTQTTEPGSIFGWLYEMGQGGDFHNAATAFAGAEAIVDRLANL